MEKEANLKNSSGKDLFVENVVYYHIQRNSSRKGGQWNEGQTYFIGGKKNPFFGFYDFAAFNIQDPISKNWYSLNEVANSMIKYIDKNEKDEYLKSFYHFSPEKSVRELYRVLEEYLKLVREWTFEEVRKEFFPNLPSRQRCLFVIPNDVQSLNYWWNTLGKNGNILKLELTGKLHRTNQQYLLATTDSLDYIREKAFRYWAGASGSSSAEDEYLFEGFAKVLEAVPVESFDFK
jgi:hypothetical protein